MAKKETLEYKGHTIEKIPACTGWKWIVFVNGTKRIRLPSKYDCYEKVIAYLDSIEE